MVHDAERGLRSPAELTYTLPNLVAGKVNPVDPVEDFMGRNLADNDFDPCFHEDPVELQLVNQVPDNAS